MDMMVQGWSTNPNRGRHGKPLSFATVNHICVVLGIAYVSQNQAVLV
jgi:hypothetical protein